MISANTTRIGTQPIRIGRSEIAVAAGLCVIIIVSRAHSHLLFHTLVEITGMVTVLTAFSLAWSGRHSIEDGFLRTAGLTLGPIVPVVMLHTLSYKGMGIFPDYTPHQPTQAWTALRLLQAGWLLAATFPPCWTISAPRLILASGIGSGLALAAILTGGFPDCFVEGQGLTRFKVVSEYAAMLALALAAWRAWRAPTPRHPRLRLLAVAILLLSCLESAAFTLYRDVFGIMNMIGHMFGLFHGLLLYGSVAWIGLATPLEALFVRQTAQKIHFEKEAEDAVNEIRGLTEILAHHLQEPVRAQYIFTERLSRSLPDALPADARQALDCILAGAKRQRALLRDVERYLSVALDVPAPRPCNCDEAWDHAARRHQHGITQAGLRLVRDTALPRVLIDPDRLTEVFSILIDNTLRHGLADQPCEMHIRASENDGYADILISDTGPGIPPDYHEQVFKFFERLTPLDHDDDRTGIGLPLARKILTQAGGDIHIVSPPIAGRSGPGLCFHIRLKAA